MRWTIQQVADALGVTPPPRLDPLARLAGVSIDSRTLRPGELFFAIRGPRHDGHTFVPGVLAAGAPASVVARDRAAEFPDEIRSRLFVVDDPLTSLQQLARGVCRAWRAGKPERRIAAVTGSAGKTTTKEILAALLASRLCVLKSEGNLNNDFGLPLTLLQLEAEDAVVVELGMSRRGELARLAAICEPEIGIVTNVAPVHLEFFASVDEIALAKRELIEGLAGKQPVAILNVDDPRVVRFADSFRGRVRYFGFSERADFRAVNVESRGIDGSAFDLESPSDRAHLQLPLVGRHNVLNALAALAAASEWGIRAAEVPPVFARLIPASMRGEILRFADEFVVINDCYNSNPVALERMIDLLCATPGHRRRILVAGTWREIGSASVDLHRAAGKYAAEKHSIDWIIGVEGDAREFLTGAIGAGFAGERTRFFSSSEQAAEFIVDLVVPGDLLLVKGSRGVRMELIVNALREKFPLQNSLQGRDQIAAGRQEHA